MNKKMLLCIAVIVSGLFLTANANLYAAVFINEFLADPPSGTAGDANRDGVRDASDDEFIEIFNTGSTDIDISNWTLSDSVRVRHLFREESSLPAGGRLVIFGGGLLDMFPYEAITASNGLLHLNNTADRITLADALQQVMDEVIYGNEAAFDQSLTRFPEGRGLFAKHLAVSKAGLAFSPGTDVEGNLHSSSLEVPEPGGILLISLLIALPGKKFCMPHKKIFHKRL
ncbi:MAG: lamin tail domain-containing protein [Candidatus Omnitrophica bacterium]|nr:lamin tail domain-containing protein [Candidatus Omnitrophota bacterium]